MADPASPHDMHQQHNTPQPDNNTQPMISTSKLLVACAAALMLGLSAPTVKASEDTAKPAAKKKDPSKDAKNPAPATPTCGTKANKGFFQRLNEAYAEQSATPAYVAPKPGDPAPKRRGFSPPFDGPPYPDSEWQLGGCPTIIGDPGDLVDSPTPLMQAIYDGPNGCAWKESRIQIYGWIDISGNLSSSHNISPKGTLPGPNGNFPESYDLRPNQIELNQAVIYIERLADEFQTDSIDWGFRISGVYGLDYRYMISRGFLDGQLLKANNYTGFDMPMIYANIYIPWIAEGMNITIGRSISLADIEAQLAPNNLMSSHSLLYSFDPYTMWGVFTTTKLNKNWTFQAGISCGNDVAPWVNDPGRQPTGTVMIQWISNDNKDSIYGGSNSFNNAQFGYNNLQHEVVTWTHKFNETVWTSTEAWYMYMEHATTGPTAAVPFQNGFYPKHAGYAPESAVLNYTNFRLADNTFLSIRNECFNDTVGQRTGYATTYSEHAIGITWWPNKLLTIRPEIRFDRSYDMPAYDNGIRKNQVTFSCDVVYKF